MGNPHEKLVLLLLLVCQMHLIQGLWSSGKPRDNLYTAVSKGDLETVKYWVENGADIDEIRGAPLKRAARDGKTEIVKVLIEAATDPNQPADNDNYHFGEALQEAADSNHLEIMDLLLKAGASVRGERLLDDAARYGHLEAVQKLLDAGADPNARKANALLAAAQSGHLDVVKAFIAAGADVNAGAGRVLYTAASQGHLDVVKTVMEAPGFNNRYMVDALRTAAYSGKMDVAKFLLSKGADPSKEDPLQAAAVTGNLEMLNLLLSHGANPNRSTSLKTACEYGRLEIVRALMEAGTRITYSWYSPLHHAAAHGHPDVVALLLQYGADINGVLERDIWSGEGKGWSVMHTVGKFDRPIIKELYDLGADINLQDVKGRTPLQISVIFEKPEIIREIQKFCANESVQNNQGKTALDLAKEILTKTLEEAPQPQDFINLLKKVVPRQISTAINNEDSRLKLRDEFIALINANSTLKVQYEKMKSPDLEGKVFSYLMLERDRAERVNMVEDNYCKAFEDGGLISPGTEYVATCACVLGQGRIMTITPIQGCSTSQA